MGKKEHLGFIGLVHKLMIKEHYSKKSAMNIAGDVNNKYVHHYRGHTN